MKGFPQLALLFLVERLKRRSGQSAGESEPIQRRFQTGDAEFFRHGVVGLHQAPLERRRLRQFPLAIQGVKVTNFFRQNVGQRANS